METDITAEAVYYKKVEREWEHIVRDRKEPENISVSEEILKSWQSCASRGISPCNSELDHWILENGFLRDGEVNKENILDDLMGQEVSLAVFDQYGNNLTWNSTVCKINFSEDNIGTNAVALAIRYEKGCFVRGPEHYLENLHDLYMYAQPFYINNNEIVGVIAGITKNVGRLRKTAEFVDLLCSIGGAVYQLKESKSLTGVMTDLMDAIPKGLAYIDKDNILKYYNKKLLEILEIDNCSNVDARVLQNIALLQNVLETDHQLVLVNNNGREKEVYFTLRKLLPGKEDYRRLVIVEDKDSLLKDNKSINRSAYNLNDIIGNCIQMQKAKEIVRVVAFEDVPVMIYGESGCGKEIFAHSIHSAGNRMDKPFIAINCGTIPENLIESELFGYERGAFTGASSKGKIGLFEAANNGTIFLDEIDSMPYSVQVKLLRALSTGKVQRVGGLKEIPVNIRIISATKIDLLELAKQGKFREDLYYRLMVVPISLPPLRERGEDVIVLAELFLEKYCQRLGKPYKGITDDLKRKIMCYPWYGNVRELKHTMEYCALFSSRSDGKADIEALPESVRNFDPDNENNMPLKTDGNVRMSRLELAEDEIIKGVYFQFNGNALKTAKTLGISVNTVYSHTKNAGGIKSAF